MLVMTSSSSSFGSSFVVSGGGLVIEGFVFYQDADWFGNTGQKCFKLGLLVLMFEISETKSLQTSCWSNTFNCLLPLYSTLDYTLNMNQNKTVVLQ